MPYMVCRCCNQSILRIDSGRLRDPRNGKTPFRIFIDHTGRQWNGFRCPDCLKKDLLEKQKARRRLKNKHKKINFKCSICKEGKAREKDGVCKVCNDQIFDMESQFRVTKKRHCRICSKHLTRMRYFYCTDCVETSDMDDTGLESTTSNSKFKIEKTNEVSLSKIVDELYEKYS